jgi:hypothetical protein
MVPISGSDLAKDLFQCLVLLSVPTKKKLDLNLGHKNLTLNPPILTWEIGDPHNTS